MIVLDTHIWVWWVHDDKQLTKSQIKIIEAAELDVIGVCFVGFRFECGSK